MREGSPDERRRVSCGELAGRGLLFFVAGKLEYLLRDEAQRDGLVDGF